MALKDTFGSIGRRLTLGQRLLATGVGVGAACGLGVAAFQLLLRAVELTVLEQVLQLQGPARWALLLAAPAAGCAAAAWLCRTFLSELHGPGIEEVSAAIAERGGAISGRVALVKLFSSALTLGTGGSGGREGPVVQIGAAVGSFLGRRLPIPADDLAVLAAAGASAGLAASFGVPLTAVVFTMEVLLRDFASEAFSAVVAASATAAALARLMLPEAHLVSIVAPSTQPLRDLALACLPAVACGAAGALYTRAIAKVERVTRARPSGSWRWAAAGGLATGALGCAWPEVLGTGDRVIAMTLAGQPVGVRGGAAAAAKIAATAATLGTGGSGGAFMPALFIGSTLGGGCRSLLRLLFDVQPPRGLLALVGTACTLTAAYRAPMTAIVMALEISRGSEAMAPVMLGVSLAYLLTRGETGAAPK